MGLIAGVLRSAVQLWLRSQLEAVADLEVAIVGSDGDFLRGQIDRIALRATAAIYRGLHLGRVELTATAIDLQWRPTVGLRAPIAAELQVTLARADLVASLDSPLLQAGIDDLLARAFGRTLPAAYGAIWETADFVAGTMVLRGPGACLEFGVTAVGGSLQLAPVRLQVGEGIWQAQSVPLALGDATISHLQLDRDRCHLAGELTVRPDPNEDVPVTAQTNLSVDSEDPASR